MRIDWTRVNKNLRCPQCGEKAYIVGGTDGTEGEHKHVFKITPLMIQELSKPSKEELAESLQKVIDDSQLKLTKEEMYKLFEIFKLTKEVINNEALTNKE